MKSKLRQAYLDDPEEPFVDVATKLDLNISDSTARYIARCLIVGLTRLKSTIFVICNKTPMDISGPPRRQKYISAPGGTLANELARRANRHPKFTLQVLAACCLDIGITRPFKVFVREDRLEKQEIIDQLVEARRQAENRSIQLICEAISLGSEAAKIVEQANIKMDIQHRLDLANKVPKTLKTKRRSTANKVFKID